MKLLLATLLFPAHALADCQLAVDAKGDTHGEVRCTNAKGVLTDLQTWKHGKFNGPWKRWTDEGRLYREENYRDQYQHGPFRLWDSTTGFPQEEGEYAFGQKVGEWITYYDSAPGGRVYHTTTYTRVSSPNESSREIADRMYDTEGRLTQSTRRDLKAGVAVREFYHSNGKLRERSVDDETKKTFERKTYSERGKLLRIERMKNSQSDGLQEQIAENGHREIECYVEGQPKDSLAPCGGSSQLAADGSETIRRHWEDGKLREEFRLLNGERDGEYKSFDRQGRVTATITYRKGTAIGGRSVDFDDEGRLIAERIVENEKTVAERAFYLNGKIREEKLRRGDRWLLKTYHDNGKLEREVPYVSDGNWWGRTYEGMEKTYDANGGLVEEAEYRAGRREGTSRRYSEGKVSAKSVYKGGRLISETYYDDQGRITASTEYHPDGSPK